MIRKERSIAFFVNSECLNESLEKIPISWHFPVFPALLNSYVKRGSD